MEQKIKLLKIYDMLVKESDETHPLSTYDIIEKLAKQGIKVERKTLYDDINLLNANGFEVKQTREKCNMYYVEKRAFDIAEVRILMDAVQAASFITPSKTKILVDKIATLAGPLKGEVVKRNIAVFDTTKHTNENIYLNVFTLNEAIINHKKISFEYFRLDARGRRVRRNAEKRVYTVSPLATLLSGDNYYLVCVTDSHPDVISNYRVDRMGDVRTLPQDIKVADKFLDFDIRKLKKQLFGMFLGERRDVTMQIDKNLVEAVYDKFGAKTRLTPYSDKYRFTAEVQISDMFFGWCFSLGSGLKILAPREICLLYRSRLLDRLKELAEND